MEPVTKNDFWSCDICGATILTWFNEADVQKHKDWHRDNNRVIANAAQVGARADHMMSPLAAFGG